MKHLAWVFALLPGITLGQHSIITDQYNLLYYTGSTFVAARWSEPLNYSSGNVTVSTTSNTLTCSSGCNFTSADVGDVIVVLQENTANVFQTTIQSLTNSESVVLAATPTFDAMHAFAYMGTDLTSAINAAMTFAINNNACLYVPTVGTEGSGYLYNGSGSSGWYSPCIIGDNPNKSLIFLGASSYLVDDDVYWDSAYFARIGYYGGTGIIRNRYASTDVTNGSFVWENNLFRDFSNSAVSINSPDMPYQYFQWNTFQALNTTTGMDIADAGGGPNYVNHNAFINQRFALKLGSPAGWKIHNNDFIQYFVDLMNVRAAIWLVPGASQDPDLGMVISENKFGNENLAYQDVRLLLADTIASSPPTSYFGDTMPTGTVSTNSIGGFYFVNNMINGGATGGATGVPTDGNPIIYSYTPNFRQNQIAASLAGTYPDYVIQFDPSVSAANSQGYQSNLFGPFLQQGFGVSPVVVSNLSGYGIAEDPTGDLIFSDPTPMATQNPPLVATSNSST